MPRLLNKELIFRYDVVPRLFILQCSVAFRFTWNTLIYTYYLHCWETGCYTSLQHKLPFCRYHCSRLFLNRYFPEDVRGKKEIEFHELKQGDM